MSSQNSYPLAWSQTGDSIEVPDHAVSWRVRRLNGSAKGGAPEMVYGPDGLPMTVDIGITPEAFAEAVERRAAKYRLDVLDESKRPIVGLPPAYVVVGGGAGRSEGGSDINEIAREAIRALAETNQKQTAQIGILVDACARLVNAVDSAGVSRRELPVALLPAPGAARENDGENVPAPLEPPWWKPVMEQVGEMLPTLIPLLIANFGPGASSGPPAAGGGAP